MVMDATQQDFIKKYGQIVARSWADPAFKQRLMTDTKSVLQEYGIEVPEGAQVQAVENTERVMHLPLPPQPEAELNDEQLEAVAGGDCASSAGTAATLGCICAFTVGTFGSAGSASSVG